MRITLLLLLGLLSCRFTLAASYYVDYTSGSDSAAGTSTATAWKHCPGDTAATGNSDSTSFAAGDTVVFKGGIRYDLASGGTLYGTSSGTPSSPIVYLSGNLASPQWGTIPASINGTNMGAAQGALTLSGYTNIVVNGITFVGSSAATAPYSSCIGGGWGDGGNISIINCSISNSAACGIYFSGSYDSSAPSTFTISNCVIQNIGAHGILLRYGMTGAQILNNVITNCGVNTDPSLTGDCIGVFGLDGTGINMSLVVRSNELADASQKSPIFFGTYDTGAIVEKNYIHGSFSYSGFDLPGTHTNLTIRNNVWDMNSTNFYGPITFDTDAGSVYADGVYIYNNTIRTTVNGNNNSMAIFFGRGNNTEATAFWNTYFTNNIVIQSTTNETVVVVAANSAGSGSIVDPSTFHCDQNIYVWTSSATPFSWRGTNYTFAQWKSVTGGDASSLTNSPLFVSSTDLHLAWGDTVARGHGANLYSLFTTDKDGNVRPSTGAWSIGAYEYQIIPEIITHSFPRLREIVF